MTNGVESVCDTPNLPGLTVVKKPGRPYDRKVYKLFGVGTSLVYGVHNNSLRNLRRGVAERVLFIKGDDGQYSRPVRPAVGVFQERLAVCKRRLLRFLPSTTPIPMEEFPWLYLGRRRAVYEDAVVSLRSRPVERRDSFLDTFTKAEKILFFSLLAFVTAKHDPAPRVIQPRHPRYNVALGRYLKPYEGMVYKAIGQMWGEVTVAKGLNAEQRGRLMERKWKRYRFPVAVGLDASRFDQHVSVDALKWEHSIYKLMNNDPEFVELLSWQLHNTGYGKARDGKVKYKVRGCRMSGDMNTALGNCLLMSSMVYSYLHSKGIRGSLINDGDDCVVFMESVDLARFSDGLSLWFEEMGFKMKVEEPVFELEQAEFCQCRPIWTPEGYLMVRNVRQSLAKDSVSLKPLDSLKVFEKWCFEVGGCGLSLTGGIPVVSNFYRCLQRASKGRSSGRLGFDPVFETGMRMMARGMSRETKEIHPATRFSFYLAFGIQPDNQVLWEKYYDSYTLRYTEAEPIYEASPSFTLAHSIPQAFSHL